MDILKEFLISSPLYARIIAYIIGIIVWSWFIFLYPGVKQQGETKDKIASSYSEQEDLATVRKKAKIQINRIIEDANVWLEKKVDDNKNNARNIMEKLNSRGLLRSSVHINMQIKRVNEFIQSMNEYKRSIDRQIEDILIDIKEESLEKAAWLKSEVEKYSTLAVSLRRAKEQAKNENNDICAKSLDEKSFRAILNRAPYNE